MICVSPGELTSDPSYLDCSDINPASVDCVPFVLSLSLPHFRFSGNSVYPCYLSASPPKKSITCKTYKNVFSQYHNAFLHHDGLHGAAGFGRRHADHSIGSPTSKAG
jgi:hypothetical protein